MVVAVPKRKADGAASCAGAEPGSAHESHPIDATVASADFDLAQYRHRPCVLKIRPQRGGMTEPENGARISRIACAAALTPEVHAPPRCTTEPTALECSQDCIPG